MPSSPISVIPTDTIYGLVGSALNKKTVEKIYHLRKRNKKKPMIILIDNIKDLKLFSINIEKPQKKILNKVWPGKVSVILPCPSKKFAYLHRGTKQLAFRLPKNKWLINFIKQTGPLVAPSANFEGEPPARNIEEAKKYFGDKVDLYVSGKTSKKSSTIIGLNKKGNIELIRPGAVDVRGVEPRGL